MRALRRKLVALTLAGSMVAATFFSCEKAFRKFQVGFWEGLGNQAAAATVQTASGLGG